LVNISSQAIALATPINGPIGERVILQVEQFGRVEGKIIRVLDHGFVMAVIAGEDERAKLLGKIVWLDQHINYEKLDDRRNKRIVPRSPHSTIVLADGSVLSCFVIDMSVSGAAVSADITPEMGMPLAVGTVVGRVARQFAGGFAIQFMEPLPLDSLEERVFNRTSFLRAARK
jgi:hypothetical protein